MTALEQLTQTINELQEPYVLNAWQWSFDYLNISNKYWYELGAKFTTHPDLVKSDLDYHNHRHSAEAILAAAVLLKEEFEGTKLQYNAPVLLFAMMCHDIAHTGDKNKHIYDLESLAVQSMQKHFQELDLEAYWNKHLMEYGQWSDFSKIIEEIILGTDFSIGPSTNRANYNLEDMRFQTLNQLKMLANEADILPSSLLDTGIHRSDMLVKERHDPNILDWKFRTFFLTQAAHFHSKASKSLGIDKNIEEQVHIIETLTPQVLNDKIKNEGIDNTISYIKSYMRSHTNKIRI